MSDTRIWPMKEDKIDVVGLEVVEGLLDTGTTEVRGIIVDPDFCRHSTVFSRYSCSSEGFAYS